MKPPADHICTDKGYLHIMHAAGACFHMIKNPQLVNSTRLAKHLICNLLKPHPGSLPGELTWSCAQKLQASVSSFTWEVWLVLVGCLASSPSLSGLGLDIAYSTLLASAL